MDSSAWGELKGIQANIDTLISEHRRNMSNANKSFITSIKDVLAEREDLYRQFAKLNPPMWSETIYEFDSVMRYVNIMDDKERSALAAITDLVIDTNGADHDETFTINISVGDNELINAGDLSITVQLPPSESAAQREFTSKLPAAALNVTKAATFKHKDTPVQPPADDEDAPASFFGLFAAGVGATPNAMNRWRQAMAIKSLHLAHVRRPSRNALIRDI